MESSSSDQGTFESIRQAIRELCSKFPESYWQEQDAKHRYPEEFVEALTKGQWLSILIPKEYGGAGLGVREAGIVLEEINRSGGNATAAHAQMYTMATLLRHGNVSQKEKWLSLLAKGELKLQAFGVTEPKAGSDTTQIATLAEHRGDVYRVSGQKVFISRVQHSDLLLLLVRTTPREQVRKKTEGLTLLLIDLREEKMRSHIRIKPITTMINHETNELFIDDAEVPVENRIGEEGSGFGYLLGILNAERILVASECLGDGQYFVDKATEYARIREVFGRPIGQNQGIQFPIAKAFMNIQAAKLMRDKAASLFDNVQECGAEANMAKYLASEASWEAANVAMTTFGGYGLTTEYGIERKFREARLPIIAPVSNNLVLSYLAEHVLQLPRSY